MWSMINEKGLFNVLSTEKQKRKEYIRVYVRVWKMRSTFQLISGTHMQT